MRPLERVSSNFRSTPKRVPQRASRRAYGAWDMFSVPPAKTISASPSMISWAALMTDWKPEPQRRLMVRAGTWMGRLAR